jgi:uncharacterized peroxidase-related enzyme
MHTAAVRRLTGDEHLSSEFASSWRQYELDPKTSELLAYAQKLTEAPAMIGDSDISQLKDAGWDDRGIYEATVLVSFFNMTGRIEAVSGLPPDVIPEVSRLSEAADPASA